MPTRMAPAQAKCALRLARRPAWQRALATGRDGSTRVRDSEMETEAAMLAFSRAWRRPGLGVPRRVWSPIGCRSCRACETLAPSRQGSGARELGSSGGPQAGRCGAGALGGAPPAFPGGARHSESSGRLGDCGWRARARSKRVARHKFHISRSGPVLNFCANNYLGLSSHPALVKACELAHLFCSLCWVLANPNPKNPNPH